MPRQRQSSDSISAEENLVKPQKRRRVPGAEVASPRAARLQVSGRKASARISGRHHQVAHHLSMAGPLRVLIAGVVVVASCSLLAVIVSNYSQYREYGTQVIGKVTQLRALQSQHGDMKRNLSFLQLPKGREQVLLQNGYLRPGDRVLLFPYEEKRVPTANSETKASTEASSETGNATAQALSDSSATGEQTKLETGDVWARAGNVFKRWWKDAQRASGSHSAGESTPSSN